MQCEYDTHQLIKNTTHITTTNDNNRRERKTKKQHGIETDEKEITPNETSYIEINMDDLDDDVLQQHPPPITGGRIGSIYMDIRFLSHSPPPSQQQQQCPWCSS